jgi:hypothetical protein
LHNLLLFTSPLPILALVPPSHTRTHLGLFTRAIDTCLQEVFQELGRTLRVWYWFHTQAAAAGAPPVVLTPAAIEAAEADRVRLLVQLATLLASAPLDPAAQRQVFSECDSLFNSLLQGCLPHVLGVATAVSGCCLGAATETRGVGLEGQEL